MLADVRHFDPVEAENGQQKYQVIACIAGRGFRVRVEDMKKMLIATRGKVFTLKSLDRLVDHSNLTRFRTKQRQPSVPTI